MKLTPDAWGYLRETRAESHSPPELMQRLQEDGYLYLKGFWPREQMAEVRQELLENLAELELTHPDAPVSEGRSNPDKQSAFTPEAGEKSELLSQVLFGPRILQFWEEIFAEDVLHFDYIWFRSIAEGMGTPPHCDIVYMGRGTRRLYTAWTPYGDISMDIGGLMLLEGSHKQPERISNYLSRDVDDYCANGPNAEAIESEEIKWEWDGKLSNNPVSLQEKYGSRWLTSEKFELGDVLIFGMEMIHASLDNQSEYLRLSSDSRYQRASEPADERWIGAEPIGHSLAGKRGRIC